MDPNCVDLFYKELEKNPENLIFRFDVKIINDKNKSLGDYIRSPKVDTYDSFISGLMQLKRGNGIIDTIYNQKVLKQVGGYRFTNYAQSADWATLISCLKFSNVVTIRHSFVHWRKGSYNISGNAYKNNYLKVKGYTDFLVDLVNDLKSQDKLSSKLIFDIYFQFSVITKIHYGKLSILNLIEVLRINISLTKNPLRVLYRTFLFYKSQ
jgi:hypothetical protein